MCAVHTLIVWDCIIPSIIVVVVAIAVTAVAFAFAAAAVVVVAVIRWNACYPSLRFCSA